MNPTRLVEKILLFICREVLRQLELQLKRFSDALEDWVNQLLSQRLPCDWRQRMHAYLDARDAEFEVAAEDRPMLENWIEGWAGLRDLLPDDKEPPSAESAAEFLESRFAQQALTNYFGDRLALPHMDHLTRDAPGPRVTGVQELKGLGAWYDEARQGGYKPWFHTRVAVAIARELLPDSEPTMVITYSDGQTLIVMGGGPTSGALASQAASIAGIGAAIKKGELMAELGENAVDTAFQEGTGSPIGPSALLSRGTSYKHSSDPKLIEYTPTTRSLADVRGLTGRQRWKAGEEYVQELYGADGQRHFPVPKGGQIRESGGRFVDVPDDTAMGIVANEVKTYGQVRTIRGASRQAFVPLSEPIRQQILKDVWLRDNLPSYDPRWIFLDAPLSEELVEFMRFHKIVSVVHAQ